MADDPFGLEKERLAELSAKRRRIAAFLAEKQLDAILIARHENIAWVTAGLVDVRVGVLRESGPASLLLTREGASYYLTTNNEAQRLAEEEFAGLDFQPVVNPWHANDLRASVKKIIGAGSVGGDMGQEGCQPVSIQSLRLELTNGEIERYRWLGWHTTEAAAAVLRRFEPGMTERAMQAMLAEQLIGRGILPSVYLTSTDARVERYPHPVPRTGVLKQLGMLCFCARRWGLTVSLTRFVCFGALPAAFEEHLAVVTQVNACLLNATREGATSDALFAVAQSAYAALGHAGAEFAHHQGGATGYLEREWFARPGGTERVAARQALAWNPHLHGAKVEDTCLLQNGKVELLTETPELPYVATTVNGAEYRSADVLRT
ncbi:MAG TPA: M24 family metallopeptidase [Terracidiphilus sp.]|nr:M24 family metallopeptidase [Terracidiphilus sp.]